MTRRNKRVENNIKYIREQIHRFMEFEYGVTYKIEVYGNKRIESEGYFSRTEFKQGKPVAIDISYQLLSKGNKGDILKAGIREAIRVALWYRRVPYGEESEAYIRELVKYQLPVYGSERQTGKVMHVYGCGNCKRVYMLRERKLPATKDITIGRYRTECCEDKFKYAGERYFKGEELYRITRRMRRDGSE